MTANKLRAAVALSVLALASTARAQSEDQQLAQTLFDEAMRLIGSGNFAAACPKLAESERLDPGGGTLINLAMCREKEGKLASAWAAYNEALSASIRDGRKERENLARERLAGIMPRLARLTINVPHDASGLEVRLDDSSVRQAAWGIATPADIGVHVVSATAPGKTPWKTTVEIKADGEAKSITVPALEDAPVEKHEAQPGVAAPTPQPTNHTAAWVVGGVGVAGVLVGTIAGISVLALKSQSDNECKSGCTQHGVDLMNQAQAVAWVSDIAFGVGLAALGTSIVLWVTAKPSSSARAWITPVIGPTGGGFVARF